MQPSLAERRECCSRHWTIRVWREEPQLAKGPDQEVRQMIFDTIEETKNVLTLFERLGKLPRVAAIEILDPAGNGGLFYPDWK
jgi:hypothetical protein